MLTILAPTVLALAAPSAPLPLVQDLVPVTRRVARTPGSTAGPGSSAAQGGGAVAGPNLPGATARPFVGSSSYEIDSFGYSDPHPPSFHPLGSALYTSNRLEESLLVHEGLGALDGVRRDDDTNGWGPAHGTMPGSPNRIAATWGDLLGDGRLLPVTIETVSNSLRIRVWERAPSGDYVAIQTDRLPSFVNVDIVCGNFDDDPRDEIALAVFKSNSSRRREIWIVDDLVDGDWDTTSTLPLVDWRVLGTAPSSSASGVGIVTAEIDGDARDELFVAFERFTSGADVYAVDDLVGGLATVADGFAPGETSEGHIRTDSGDTNGDGVDEFFASTRDTIAVRAISGSGFSDAGSIFVGSSSAEPIAFAAYDRNGSGQHDVAFLDIETRQNGGWTQTEYDEVRLEFAYRGSSDLWFTTGETLLLETSQLAFGQDSGVRASDLVRVEDRGDGRDAVRIAAVSEGLGSTWLHEFRVEDRQVRDESLRDNLGANPERLFLLAGDDDAETTTLRWTGEKELHLSSPMPVVVMEAVPTKAGIQQNYAQSESTFSQSTGASQSFATRSSTTIGLTAGLTSPDLFGLFDAQAKATISGTITNTTGSTESVRTFTTYGSGHDVHSIVFQGTLYHAYMYEVVKAADPAAVGTVAAINVPVETNEWKWTLDEYNSVFPGARIDPTQVFANASGVTAIGDPTSYPDRAELEGLVTGSTSIHDGWVGGSSTVGLGTAFNGFGLSLGSVSTTTSERTLALDVATEFTAAGTIFGASYGVSSGSVYTIETSTTTEYEARIGDIDAADYPAWNYTAGLVVYQDRTGGVAPYQVMRYWVEPTGTAYP